MSSRKKVFVYGTLLQGKMRHPVVESERYLGPAMVRGELIDLGHYPALIEGSGTVVGEVYEVRSTTLEQLDRIEGYDPGHPAASLYHREMIEARYFADGRREQVLAYRYHRRARGESIDHGDYRRYKLEAQSGAQWVLAYGSNLCRDRLSERVGEPLAVERGRLMGYTLSFNKHAQGRGAVCANVSWVGGTSVCPLVAWKLDRDQIDILDGYEGTPDHYLRVSLPFIGEERGLRMCQGYVAHPDRLIHGLSPTAEYLGHVYRGYRLHGFAMEQLPSLKG